MRVRLENCEFPYHSFHLLASFFRSVSLSFFLFSPSSFFFFNFNYIVPREQRLPQYSRNMRGGQKETWNFLLKKTKPRIVTRGWVQMKLRFISFYFLNSSFFSWPINIVRSTHRKRRCSLVLFDYNRVQGAKLSLKLHREIIDSKSCLI